MKKRNLILASFVILLAILTGACSTQEQSLPIQEADMPIAENPVSEPEVEQTENPSIMGSASYLFAPIRSKTTYLMDAEGNALHTWESAYTPGNAVYLLEMGICYARVRYEEPISMPAALAGSSKKLRQMARLCGRINMRTIKFSSTMI